LSFKNYKHPNRLVAATISLIISALLVVVCVSLVRDRWRDPEIKSTEQANNSTTGMVVRGTGATLSPTEPKLSVEPDVPKVAQPADHPAPESAPK
jgi:hypothetical protein